MTQQTPTEYCINKQTLLNTPFIIDGQGGWFEYEGQLIAENEFLKMFPLGDKIRPITNDKGPSIGSASW